MRIFAYEFVTGGGLHEQQFADNLVSEGDLIIKALVHDLTRIAGVEVVVSRDPRLPGLELPASAQTIAPQAGEHPLDLFVRGVGMADAVWPVAPEIGGVLDGLTQLSVESGKTLLASRPRAVRAATSKLLTVTALSANGIACVPSFVATQELSEIPGPWVIKPDDGAGCSNSFMVENVATAREVLSKYSQHNFIAQPWLEGDPYSLSLLCADGQARLLSINRQHIAVQNGVLSLSSVFVNAKQDADGTLTRLAERIAAVFTGLWGHVGVDFIQSERGPIVLEVNPRLTTSYAGLSRALGLNAAQLVLDLAASGKLPPPPQSRGKPVILDW